MRCHEHALRSLKTSSTFNYRATASISSKWIMSTQAFASGCLDESSKKIGSFECWLSAEWDRVGGRKVFWWRKNSAWNSSTWDVSKPNTNSSRRCQSSTDWASGGIFKRRSSSPTASQADTSSCVTSSACQTWKSSWRNLSITQIGLFSCIHRRRSAGDVVQQWRIIRPETKTSSAIRWSCTSCIREPSLSMSPALGTKFSTSTATNRFAKSNPRFGLISDAETFDLEKNRSSSSATWL